MEAPVMDTKNYFGVYGDAEPADSGPTKAALEAAGTTKGKVAACLDREERAE